MCIFVTDGMKFFDSYLLNNIMDQKNAEIQCMLQTTSDLQYLTDDSGSTLLHYAAQYGNAMVAQYLIDIGCKVDALDESGNSPLMLALKSDHLATIEVLMNANADMTIRDTIGRTILESVLQAGALTRSPEIKAMFLNRVIAMCNDDDTLIANKLIETDCSFIEAIRLNRPGVVKIMLENGSSVEDRDVDCNTTLHLAVKLMNLDTIKLLIQHGARVDARGCHGRTPLLQYDLKFKDSDVKLQILRYLLEQGASLKVPDLFGMTPLTFLLCGGDRDILQIVMQYNIDLCGLNKFHQNALHYLVENKCPGVLEAIRGQRFEVNAINNLGFTPLLLAVKNYDLEKIEFLLEHGADVNAQSLDGHTAMILLFMNRLEEEKNIINILELLLQHGADVRATFQSRLTIFDLAVQNNFFFRIKLVISRIVMSEALGNPIDQLILGKIYSNSVFRRHYEKCKLQIRQLKYNIVYGSVSLFTLLFDSEDKLVLYARNTEFESNFTNLMLKVKNVDSYILNILSRRVEKAMKIAQLRESSALAICRITELPISTSYTILYRIVDYLDNQDLDKLRKM